MAAAGVSLEEKAAADPTREAELGGLAGALGIGIAFPSAAENADKGFQAVDISAAAQGQTMGATGVAAAGMGVVGTAGRGLPAPPLHAAAAADDIETLVAITATAKGDSAALATLLNQRDAAGSTPWHYAAKHGAMLAVRWLAKQPAVDTDAVTEDEMQAHAIHLCIIGSSMQPSTDYFQVLHFLLAENLGTVHLRDAQKCTALIVAAQHGSCLCTHLLLSYGADLHAVDEAGDTALHWAAYKGHDDVCHIIMDAQGAASSLLERGDSFGQTPLHLAALRGNVRAAMALVERGADVGARDGQGKRPIDLVRAKVTQGVDKLRKKASVDIALLGRQRHMVHFLEPTWKSFVTMAPDKPYYVVLLSTAIAMIGYTQVMLNTPAWLGAHLFCLFLQSMMHVTWQITRRTDPGTFGLREESVSLDPCSVQSLFGVPVSTK